MRIVTNVLALVFLVPYMVTCLPFFLEQERPNNLRGIHETNTLFLDRWQSEKANPLTVPSHSLHDPIITYSSEADELRGDLKKSQGQLAEVFGITGVLYNSQDRYGQWETVTRRYGSSGMRKRATFSGDVENRAYVGVPSGVSTSPPIRSTRSNIDSLWSITPAPIPTMSTGCHRDGGSCWRDFIDWCKGVWESTWSKIKDLFTPECNTTAVALGTESPRYHNYGAIGRHDWYCCEDCWSSETGCADSRETYC